ncbi:FCPE [Symbiodinium natans]|uniref:FCPE protein n=1 Tax=Symbiodinium natans TaxID=878477 RepID=A0A812NQA8_9DINO|nr:FCPE [Symbiodinium natans]
MAPSTWASAAALAACAAPAMAFVPAGQSLRGNAPASASASASSVAPSASASASSGSWATAGLATAAVVAGATAFRARPAPRRVERNVVGVCMPLTEKFDPLNLGDTDAKMERYTAVEIKHGRVSMIAVVGYIMPEIFRFPGCEDFKHGLGAFESIPLEGWIQLFALVGAHEVLVKPREGGLGSFDFGNGTELLDGIDDEELERRLTSERNNGRLAMVAIMGLMWQDGTFGEAPLSYMNKNGFWGEPVQFIVQNIGLCRQPNLCALPSGRTGRTTMHAIQKLAEGDYVELETYPKEMEMSPSVPFLRYPQVLKGWVGEEKGFDPLGVTDALPVYWVREAELKHGRICMLATVGWIATDLGFRFPGEKFQAVANSVEAHDKMVEAGYMLPFLGAVGVFELFSLWLFFQSWPLGEGINRDAGDYWLGKQFLPKDPAKEKDMRLKELENGRLAMFAFSGIVTQAVATGKPWPFF